MKINDILRYAITGRELLDRFADDCYGNRNRIVVRVAVRMNELVDADGIDEFNDIINDKIILDGNLMDISYSAVGVTDRHDIIVEVYAEVDFYDSDEGAELDQLSRFED